MPKKMQSVPCAGNRVRMQLKASCEDQTADVLRMM
jgi:hypothetical protein